MTPERVLGVARPPGSAADGRGPMAGAIIRIGATRQAGPTIPTAPVTGPMKCEFTNEARPVIEVPDFLLGRQERGGIRSDRRHNGMAAAVCALIIATAAPRLAGAASPDQAAGQAQNQAPGQTPALLDQTQAPTDDTGAQLWAIHGQSTFTEMYQPAFRSPYQGSLQPAGGGQRTRNIRRHALCRLPALERGRNLDQPGGRPRLRAGRQRGRRRLPQR